MKIIFILIFSLFSLTSFSQIKSKMRSKKAEPATLQKEISPLEIEVEEASPGEPVIGAEVFEVEPDYSPKPKEKRKEENPEKENPKAKKEDE